ncbi:unnamed protein product [Albugo candida]|uniref:Uncharacterized protein n=1 Tax=Albugo candida TaxID=65357 RepID=A0A024GI46_9STRA|nr:unnamed protein product [Albugo candida]|eukprot:CCI46202.1 unnamed protein product [Albugo candida]
MERAVLAVDVEHSLTDFLESLVLWHNKNHDQQLSRNDFTTDAFENVWGGTSASTKEKMERYYKSQEFSHDLRAMGSAREVLKKFRPYFKMIAVTKRPRTMEKLTREWLDENFDMVFDRLMFVDFEDKSGILEKKREMYEKAKVQVAVGSDASLLPAGGKIKFSVSLNHVPWNGVAEDSDVTRVSSWSEMEAVLRSIVDELGITRSDNVRPAPKLSRFEDDLVTVSRKKPAGFYAHYITNKFDAHHRKSIRMQATYEAISTAIQAAELVRLEKKATISKISTEYAHEPSNASRSRHVPKIELILTRIQNGNTETAAGAQSA